MQDILGLNFVKTCDACPEQYDVYTKDSKRIGYVRLRWGLLRADYINDDKEKTIYTRTFPDEDGSFPTEEDRKHHLKKIAKELIETDLYEKLKVN